MQKTKIFIGISLAVVLLLVVGYFFIQKNPSPTGNVIFEGKSTFEGDVSELVFDISELSEGYYIAERTPRTRLDVSEFGLNLGWQEGYYVRYIKGDEDNIFDVSRIELSISRYPIENISKGIDNIYEVEGYTVERLPDPKIGVGSVSTRYTDNEFGFREYRVEFYKKDIYITLNSGGTVTDYETLKELTEKVDDKI